MSLQAKRVVEQSRQVRPTWLVGPSSDSWQLNQVGFEFVSTKERVLDITLGLDQAYVAAIAEMRLKVRDFLLQQWAQQSNFASLTAEDRSSFDRQLLKILETRVDGSVVQDIYFEKLFVPNAEETLRDTYTIYVQMRLDAPQLAQVLREFQNYCAASPKEGWQKFAKNSQAFPIDSLQRQIPQSDQVETGSTLNSP